MDRQIEIQLGHEPRQPHDLRQRGLRVGQHRFDSHGVVGQVRAASASQRRMNQQHIGLFDDQLWLGQSPDLRE